ncbi:RagB/SusD family nutrient uptake outer membrane protein [Pontibacter harenae]|uniref:RagB/SusD family nutrient uptake outer membrane protein n=1 Tax=Pontibacter harenae TaxID=2894083 RepID=UPI001E335AC0|nr:RagB/SusD family nutrient uptake outer membrane protein [Pontibacter harenae]MCC9168169.1 RagB/SusD family nutrient uptake outer membrane protein [Pontibacter harenae]
MKNIFKKAVPLALAALMLVGCEKEYLETSPNSDVPNELVFSTTDGALVGLNGIYRFMWSSENHDAFGQKALDIAMDYMGSDMFTPVRGYGWFVNDYNLSSLAATTNASRSGYAWRHYYRVIFNANNLIANIDGATGTEEDREYIKGNALALRAYAYFYLINLFQHTYVGNENAPGVPLYTEPNVEGKGRGTVQEVYTQIIADLTEAERLLEGKTRMVTPSHINVNVAQGLHARVALQMEDYATAATMANEARQGRTLMNAAAYQNGFSMHNAEWIWGLQIPNDQATIYASFYSHMDNTAFGYAGLGSTKLIARELYEAIPEGDVRKELFQAPVAEPTDDDWMNYTSFKFRKPNPSNWAGDYVMMRASEMYLIEAEALAKTNREAEAVEVLEELVQARYPEYTAPATSGQELIEEILLQRRIELWGEGFSLLDMKRLNRDLNRTVGSAENGEHEAGLAVVTQRSITDNAYLWRIPQTEIDSNEALTAADQNP